MRSSASLERLARLRSLALGIARLRSALLARARLRATLLTALILGRALIAVLAFLLASFLAVLRRTVIHVRQRLLDLLQRLPSRLARRLIAGAAILRAHLFLLTRLPWLTGPPTAR